MSDNADNGVTKDLERKADSEQRKVDTEQRKEDTEQRKEDKNDNETKEAREPKCVSFNRDVHVKRFGKPRESRGASAEPSVRKEPFTHLSERELIDEANKVIAQAQSVTCTADHPPEKFFSLPHRKKHKDDKERRNSDDAGDERKPLGRSTSDASKRGKERTSLSTLFRRNKERNRSPNLPVVVQSKPVIVKRSKSDVSDLKSNTNLNQHSKPIRKRSGSETEEFLRSLRNTKTQLSPIIESSPRDDYFKKTPPLELFQNQKIAQKDSVKSEISTDNKKVNPVEKPPRYKTPEKSEPKPPIRSKRGKSLDKETSPPISDTPKRKTDIKKTLLVDEIDSKAKDTNSVGVKERIKDSIRKIEENIYGDKGMIHSSQQPPDKPLLTRGNTVDHIVRILKEDQLSPPPKTHLISNGTSVNQPFSYTKPSVSPDPNLFIRNTSPERVPSPVNKMADKGVVYAHVVRDHDNFSNLGKQTVHKTYSREKYGNSDEDEGLGYEEKYKYSPKRYDYEYKPGNEVYNSLEGPKITDSPIRPRFREYKLTSFDDFEPTYANESPNEKSHNYIDSYRGRADGMDTIRKEFETENKVNLDFNELSHRRKLLESRINARRFDRINTGEPVSRYLAATDPIYEATKRMKATEKYVNETAKYIHHTLERDGFTESNIAEDFNRYDSDGHKIKYNTESKTFQRTPKEEFDRREFLDNLDPRFTDKKGYIPPEPEYEPPSLELHTIKRILNPSEYKEKKYKVKKNVISSHDVLQSQKYKKDDWFGKRKGHYASNPEIAQEREDEYANISPKHESYHNSLRRMKNKDKHYTENYGITRHDSGDSRDYYRDQTPRRYDIDNRLVDSGIENDFRKDSGEIHRTYQQESDEDARNTSLFLASERRHTEDNYPSEQIYANGEYTTLFKGFKQDRYSKDISRERSDGSLLDSKRYDAEDKISAKPPKAKKFFGLEKVKQLFSRDSSKESKREKETIPPKSRTRVLKSPEHLSSDSDYRRYTDPEPSDLDSKKREDPKEPERKFKSSREYLDRDRISRESPDRHRSSRESLNRRRSSREHLDRHRSSREHLDRSDKYKSSKEELRYRSSDPRESDDRKYRETDFDSRYERTTERRHVARRPTSSDCESELRPSDTDSDRRKTRSRTAGPLDSPALAERYRERRRLATPSPTPSRATPAPAPTTAGNWFKSLDRLARKKNVKKLEKEASPSEDNTRKTWPKKPLNSPAKNLRFFGDTDQDSDPSTKQTVTKSKSHPSHSTLRKTTSDSSAGVDEPDFKSAKSYSLGNLVKESPRPKYYKRNLQNISEIHNNSEAESQFERKASKPPISPYDRSRSHSSSKTLKGDSGRNGSQDLRRRNGSSSDLRSSAELREKEFQHRRRTTATTSGESSTEGDSSHQSQRSVVYLHATTVGDIPDPGRIHRNRSRDDVSSVNSSNLQVRSTTKSFSLFAPWTPRHYNDQHDVHYAQRPRRHKSKETLTKKSSSSKNLAEDRPSLQKNKSYSQTTLTRKPQSSRLSSSSTTLYRKPEKKTVQGTTLSRGREKKSQSNEVLNSDARDISRSLSMPKDGSKKAGWFKLSNKTKKQETTRVR